jgi:hypothetical protein
MYKTGVFGVFDYSVLTKQVPVYIPYLVPCGPNAAITTALPPKGQVQRNLLG